MSSASTPREPSASPTRSTPPTPAATGGGRPLRRPPTRLADKIHTPDSSRYWRADTYPQRLAAGERPDSFDKDVIRAWVAARCDPYKDDVPEIPPELIWKTALTYVEAHEQITGRAFEPPGPAPPVHERVLAALGDFHGR